MSTSQKVRDHLRTNVVGYVAVFIALTMTPALAARIAPKNSVVSKSIKNGQVKSADVKDNSLTGADIKESTLKGLPLPPNGSLAESKLSFDPATQGELDAFSESLSTAGSINNAQNPVHWSKLKNVPAGFADGADGPGNLRANGGLVHNAGGLGLELCPSGPARLQQRGSQWSCVSDPGYLSTNAMDTTPSVRNVQFLLFYNAFPLVLTDLDDSDPGQIVILGNTNGTVSIDGDSYSDSFSVSGDWNPTPGDTITLVYVLGTWYEVARSSNS